MKLSRFHITVDPWEAVVPYRQGVRLATLEAGRHRKQRHAEYKLVDLRANSIAIANQDVPTFDGASVRVTAKATVRVVDPIAYLENHQNPMDVIHVAVQVGIRQAIASVSAADLSARLADGSLWAGLSESVAQSAVAVGVEASDVIIRDVVLPHEIRSAATMLHTAKMQGQAKVERAKAETAALRSLANGAKLLDSHPALAKLRLIEAMPHGAQLVLRVGDDALPVN